MHPINESVGLSRRALVTSAALAAVPATLVRAGTSSLELGVTEAIERHKRALTAACVAQDEADELRLAQPADVIRPGRILVGTRLQWDADTGGQIERPIYACSNAAIDTAVNDAFRTRLLVASERHRPALIEAADLRRARLKADLAADKASQKAKQEAAGLHEADRRAEVAWQEVTDAGNALFALRPRTLAGLAVLAGYLVEKFDGMPDEGDTGSEVRAMRTIVVGLKNLSHAGGAS